MSWFPLHCHSHFSLLDGLSKPEQIAARIAECEHPGSALTDHGSVAGCPAFIKQMTKAKLKPIAGSEFYICQQDAAIREKENRSLSHLCVLAKNAEGWKNLVRASSASHHPDLSYHKPRLNLERLAEFSQGQFIVFSGHMGSDLANCIFEDPRQAYGSRSETDAKQCTRKEWHKVVFAKIKQYQQLFGEENFFVEIQLIDHQALPASVVIAEGLRWAAKKLGVPCVATADSHYCRKEDAIDQRVLLCSAFETTMKEVQRKLEANEDVTLGGFFRSNNYHIPTLAEMQELHTPEELANTLKIADRCEVYPVGGKPMLPVVQGPHGESPEQYLKHFCRIGWEAKIEKVVPSHKLKTYAERIRHELQVLLEAGLSSYFLVVKDYVDQARDVMGCLIGPGRGSGAGCLVSYLLGITDVDPIEYDLIFERFYNAGRNSPGRIALPDIDTDFPTRRRKDVIQYLRDKYGADKVCQMSTFSRMQGRGAIKDVLRVHERCSFEEMNRLTEFIPDEAEISDQLQEMREETGEASIIEWALQNNTEQLKEWCWRNPDTGELEGPFALDFAQAIRLEGTKRNMGKHASGVIISAEPLAEICPMLVDKSTRHGVLAIDMKDAEEMGLVKFDILGVTVLDKIMDATQLIRTGSMR